LPFPNPCLPFPGQRSTLAAAMEQAKREAVEAGAIAERRMSQAALIAFFLMVAGMGAAIAGAVCGSACARTKAREEDAAVARPAINLVAGVAPSCASMDKQCPGRLSRGILARRTVIEPWGGSRRPLFSDCGRRSNHQPHAIPDRLIGRLQPTLALRTRMGGVRRFVAQALPGHCRKGIP
jgi:hypothetical protein